MTDSATATMASAQKPPSATKHALKIQVMVTCHRELNARSMGGQCLGKGYCRHRRERRHISEDISFLPCSDGIMIDHAI